MKKRERKHYSSIWSFVSFSLSLRSIKWTLYYTAYVNVILAIWDSKLVKMVLKNNAQWSNIDVFCTDDDSIE